MTHYPGPVPYEGSKNATLAFVGEAPGADEVRPQEGWPQGRPFVGLAGKKQDRLNAQIGVARGDARWMNICRFRPPKNDFGVLWKDTKQTEPTELLEEEIKFFNSCLEEMPNLRVIVTLGRQATYVVTGKAEGVLQDTVKDKRSKISHWRGSIIAPGELLHVRQSKEKQPTRSPFFDNTKAKYKVIPTYHPSLICRMPEYTQIALMDLRKAYSTLNDGVPHREMNYIVYPTVEQIFRFCEQARSAYGPLICDIETRHGIISRLGLGYFCDYGSKVAPDIISIPFINIETGERTGNDHLWPFLRALFEEKEVVGQNFGQYDLFWLERPPYDCRIRVAYDTMAAQHVMLPGLPKQVKPLSLAFLNSIWVPLKDHQNIPYYKDESKDIEGKPPPDRQYGEYSCKDIDATGQVYLAQRQQTLLKERKETFDFEMALINGPIREIMQKGILVDVPYKERLKKRAELECEFLALSLCKEIGRSINIGSYDQLRDLLFGDLGMKPVGRKTKAGKYSTDEDALKILGAIYPDAKPLNLTLKFREVEALRKGILSATVDSDDRMRTTYKQTTDTGRLASTTHPYSTKKHPKGFATSTTPRSPKVRKIFIPDPGMIWVSRDLSQAEAKVVYCLAGADKMIAFLEEGKKAHQEVVAMVLDKRSTDCGKGTKNYELGKKLVHSANYMISGQEHSRTCRKELGLNINKTEAQRHIDRYYELVPEVPKWHQHVFRCLCQNKMTLTTPLGRTRKFFGRFWPSSFKSSRDLMKKAVAFLPQATIGDLLNKIILRWYAIKTVGEFLFPVIDEMNTQCWPKNLDLHLEESDKAFDLRFDIGRYAKVLIPWDTDIKKNWGERL